MARQRDTCMGRGQVSLQLPCHVSRRSVIPSVPRPTLARMTDRALARLIVCTDGEDELTIILPAPKGVEPPRWRVS